jgi:hypothetical protein
MFNFVDTALLLVISNERFILNLKLITVSDLNLN